MCTVICLSPTSTSFSFFRSLKTKRNWFKTNFKFPAKTKTPRTWLISNNREFICTNKMWCQFLRIEILEIKSRKAIVCTHNVTVVNIMMRVTMLHLKFQGDLEVWNNWNKIVANFHFIWPGLKSTLKLDGRWGHSCYIIILATK